MVVECYAQHMDVMTYRYLFDSFQKLNTSFVYRFTWRHLFTCTIIESVSVDE